MPSANPTQLFRVIYQINSEGAYVVVQEVLGDHSPRGGGKRISEVGDRVYCTYSDLEEAVLLRAAEMLGLGSIAEVPRDMVSLEKMNPC